jgi:hypothetical protein
MTKQKRTFRNKDTGETKDFAITTKDHDLPGGGFMQLDYVQMDDGSQIVVSDNSFRDPSGAIWVSV